MTKTTEQEIKALIKKAKYYTKSKPQVVNFSQREIELMAQITYMAHLYPDYKMAQKIAKPIYALMDKMMGNIEQALATMRE